MKTRFLTLFLLIALVLAGCGNNGDEIEETIKKQVQIQEIAKQDQVNSSLSVSGTIVPKQYSMVRSLTQGTIEYLAPVGSQVSIGQPLFSIRDDAIESNYFSALQSYEQTNIITDQRVKQAELALNSSRARLDLAESQFNNTIAQTEQSLITSEDSAIAAYNSAYNSLNQALNFLSLGGVSNYNYRYKNIPTPYSEFRSDTDLAFSVAAGKFLELDSVVTRDNLSESLNKINKALVATKQAVDNSAILLQSALAGNDFTATSIAADTLTNTAYQTAINQHTGGIINSINSITNTKINNRLAINNAQAQLDLSNIEYNNAEISYDNADNSTILEKNIAQAQFDNAAYGYNNLSLAAPFSGTILSHFANAGEQASPGQQLIEVGDLSIIEISVDIDVAFAKAIKLNDRALINEKIEGFVAAIDPVGDLTSGKITVVVQTNDEESELITGEIAEVKFNLIYEEVDSIVIPIKAATIEASGNYVFVIEKDKVARKNVVLGQVFNDKVSVVEGLNEGDRLILLNGIFVSVGDEVEIVE